MKIGRFFLISVRDGEKFWIDHDDGEGMEVDAATLEKAIADLFEKEF